MSFEYRKVSNLYMVQPLSTRASSTLSLLYFTSPRYGENCLPTHNLLEGESTGTICSTGEEQSARAGYTTAPEAVVGVEGA